MTDKPTQIALELEALHATYNRQLNSPYHQIVTYDIPTQPDANAFVFVDKTDDTGQSDWIIVEPK